MGYPYGPESWPTFDSLDAETLRSRVWAIAERLRHERGERRAWELARHAGTDGECGGLTALEYEMRSFADEYEPNDDEAAAIYGAAFFLASGLDGDDCQLLLRDLVDMAESGEIGRLDRSLDKAAELDAEQRSLASLVAERARIARKIDAGEALTKVERAAFDCDIDAIIASATEKTQNLLQQHLRSVLEWMPDSEISKIAHERVVDIVSTAEEVG